MMKKVWLMFVLCSFMMVVGCSGKFKTEDMQAVSMDSSVEDVSVAEVVVEDTGGTFEQNAMEETYLQEAVSDDEKESELTVEDNTSAEAVSGSKDDVVATEESTALTEQGDDTKKEEVSTTETPVVEVQTTREQATTEPSAQEPTTQAPVAKEEETDERGNPADGSPVFEITFNIPQAEYVGYDADRVARLAIDKCKAAGMISLPENLDNLLAEGKITQEEYNEYYPYDGCGYYSVFVETNLNLASTISGERLCSEEEIADYIAGMMVLEVDPYFYIECAGVYQGNHTEFYEFRCYR